MKNFCRLLFTSIVIMPLTLALIPMLLILTSFIRMMDWFNHDELTFNQIFTDLINNSIVVFFCLVRGMK